MGYSPEEVKFPFWGFFQGQLQIHYSYSQLEVNLEA